MARVLGEQVRRHRVRYLVREPNVARRMLFVTKLRARWRPDLFSARVLARVGWSPHETGLYVVWP
jgi:hypothetical protein